MELAETNPLTSDWGVFTECLSSYRNYKKHPILIKHSIPDKKANTNSPFSEVVQSVGVTATNLIANGSVSEGRGSFQLSLIRLWMAGSIICRACKALRRWWSEISAQCSSPDVGSKGGGLPNRISKGVIPLT